MRPVAPPEIFDDLVSLARLEAGARLLEIGCGTGQATLPLAQRGFAIVAIELGEKLAAAARRKLAAFPDVKVVTSAFEDWDAAGQRFDAVVCFNAFHWIDPEVRFAKPATLLRDGGALAVVAMKYVTPDDADPGWVALQQDYDAVVPSADQDRPPHPDAVPDRSHEFEDSGHFRDVRVRRRLWTVTFDAAGYIALLRSSSWHRRLDEGTQHALFARLHERIRAQPGGVIRPSLLATLYVARRR